MAVRARAVHFDGAAGDVSVVVGPDDDVEATIAEEIVREEIGRLGQVFDIDDDTSLINRWIDDASIATSNEFDRLLSTAMMWQRLSRGAYNVSMRRLHDLWERAAADGCRPSPGELHELAREITQEPYRLEGRVLRQLSDCRGLDLSAIVTGFILDVATEVAMSRCRLDSLTVIAGERVVSRGRADVEVCVATLADRSGASPTFTLRNSAVATLRPNHHDPGQRSARVLDPLTGHVISNSVSVAVVAPDATTADVVAAVVRTMTPARGLNFVDALNSPGRARHPSEFSSAVTAGAIRCWIVDARREAHSAAPCPSRV